MDLARLECGVPSRPGFSLVKLDPPGAGGAEVTASARIESEGYAPHALPVTPKGCVEIPHAAQGRVIALNRDRSRGATFEWKGPATRIPVSAGLVSFAGLKAPRLRCPASPRVNHTDALFRPSLALASEEPGHAAPDWRRRALVLRAVSADAEARVLGTWKHGTLPGLSLLLSAAEAELPLPDGRYFIRSAAEDLAGNEIAGDTECMLDLRRTPPQWDLSLPTLIAAESPVALPRNEPDTHRFLCIAAAGSNASAGSDTIAASVANACSDMQNFVEAGAAFKLPGPGKWIVHGFNLDDWGNRSAFHAHQITADGTNPTVAVSPRDVQSVGELELARSLTGTHWFDIKLEDDTSPEAALEAALECRVRLLDPEGTRISNEGLQLVGAAPAPVEFSPCEKSLGISVASLRAAGKRLALDVRTRDSVGRTGGASATIWMTKDLRQRDWSILSEQDFPATSAVILSDARGGLVALASAPGRENSEGKISFAERPAPSRIWRPFATLGFPVAETPRGLQAVLGKLGAMPADEDREFLWIAGRDRALLRMATGSNASVAEKPVAIPLPPTLKALPPGATKAEFVALALDKRHARLLLLERTSDARAPAPSGNVVQERLLAFDGRNFRLLHSFEGESISQIAVNAEGGILFAASPLDDQRRAIPGPQTLARLSEAAPAQNSRSLPFYTAPYVIMDLLPQPGGGAWIISAGAIRAVSADGTEVQMNSGLPWHIVRSLGSETGSPPPSRLSSDGTGVLLLQHYAQLFRWEEDQWNEILRPEAKGAERILAMAADADGLLHALWNARATAGETGGISLASRGRTLWRTLMEGSEGSFRKWFACGQSLCALAPGSTQPERFAVRAGAAGWESWYWPAPFSPAAGRLHLRDLWFEGPRLKVLDSASHAQSGEPALSAAEAHARSWVDLGPSGEDAQRALPWKGVESAGEIQTALLWNPRSLSRPRAESSAPGFHCAAPPGFLLETAFRFAPLQRAQRSFWLAHRNGIEGSSSRIFSLSENAACDWKELPMDLADGEGASAVASSDAESIAVIGTNAGRIFSLSTDPPHASPLPGQAPVWNRLRNAPAGITKLLRDPEDGAWWALFEGSEHVGVLCPDGRWRLHSSLNVNLPGGAITHDLAFARDESLWLSTSAGVFALPREAKKSMCEAER